MKSLSIVNRISLRVNLPKIGGSVALSLKESIVDKIKITSDEIEKYELKDAERGIQMSKDGLAAEFDIDFSDPELDLIKKHLRKMDDEEKLNDAAYALFKIFC